MSLKIQYSNTVEFTKLSKKEKTEKTVELNDIIRAALSSPNYQAIGDMVHDLTACSSPNLITIFKKVLKLSNELYLNGIIVPHAEENLDPNEATARSLNDFLSEDYDDEVMLAGRQIIKSKLIEKVNTFYNQFNLSELVISASALEFLECRDQALFSRMRIRLVKPLLNKSSDISLKMLPSMAYGFSHKNSKDIKFFDYIANRLNDAHNIDTLSKADLVRLARGFTNARFQNRCLFDHIERSASEPRRNFTTNEAIDLFWSYANVISNMKQRGGYEQHACSKLIAWLKTCILNENKQLSIGQLCRLAWCDRQFGSMDAASRQILDKPENLPTLRDCSSKKFVTYFVSRSQDQSIDISHYNEYVKIALERIKGFSPTELTRIAYGMVVVVCSREDFCDEILPAIHQFIMKIYDISHNYFDSHDLSRISSICLLYIKKGYPIEREIPKSLASAIDKYFDKLRKEKKESSDFHKEVESYLKQFKKGFISEYSFFGFSLDIAYLDEKIAIEVDGDKYHKDQHNRLNAKDLVKENLLKIFKWNLYRVSSSTWFRLESNDDKIRFLKNLLKPRRVAEWRRRPILKVEKPSIVETQEISIAETNKPSVEECDAKNKLRRGLALRANQLPGSDTWRRPTYASKLN